MVQAVSILRRPLSLDSSFTSPSSTSRYRHRLSGSRSKVSTVLVSLDYKLQATRVLGIIIKIVDHRPSPVKIGIRKEYVNRPK